MGKEMTSKLITLRQDLLMLNDSRMFYKLHAKKLIRNTRNILKKLYKKKEYYSTDIVELALFVNTAIELKLIDSIMDDLYIEYFTNQGKTIYPIIGRIFYSFSTKDRKILDIEFSSVIHNEAELDSDIEVKWTTYGNVIGDYHPMMKSTSNTKHVKSIYYFQPQHMSDYVLSESYRIISNIFSIVIETVLDGVERMFIYND